MNLSKITQLGFIRLDPLDSKEVHMMSPYLKEDPCMNLPTEFVAPRYFNPIWALSLKEIYHHMGLHAPPPIK